MQIQMMRNMHSFLHTTTKSPHFPYACVVLSNPPLPRAYFWPSFLAIPNNGFQRRTMFLIPFEKEATKSLHNLDRCLLGSKRCLRQNLCGTWFEV